MATGFYVAASITVADYRRRGGNPDQMWNLLVWVFVAGLVGSRLLSVANDLPGFVSFARNQQDIPCPQRINSAQDRLGPVAESSPGTA